MAEEEQYVMPNASNVYMEIRQNYPHTNRYLYGHYPKITLPTTTTDKANTGSIYWGYSNNGNFVKSNAFKTMVFYDKTAVSTTADMADSVIPYHYGTPDRTPKYDVVVKFDDVIMRNLMKASTKVEFDDDNVTISAQVGYKYENSNHDAEHENQVTFSNAENTFLDAEIPPSNAPTEFQLGYRVMDPCGEFIVAGVRKNNAAVGETPAATNYGIVTDFYAHGNVWKYWASEVSASTATVRTTVLSNYNCIPPAAGPYNPTNTSVMYPISASGNWDEFDVPLPGNASWTDLFNDYAYAALEGLCFKGYGFRTAKFSDAEPRLLRKEKSSIYLYHYFNFCNSVDGLTGTYGWDGSYKSGDLIFYGSFIAPFKSSKAVGLTADRSNSDSSCGCLSGICSNINVYACDKTSMVVVQKKELQTHGDTITDDVSFSVLPKYEFSYEYSEENTFGNRVNYFGKKPISIDLSSYVDSDGNLAFAGKTIQNFSGAVKNQLDVLDEYDANKTIDSFYYTDEDAEGHTESKESLPLFSALESVPEWPSISYKSRNWEISGNVLSFVDVKDTLVGDLFKTGVLYGFDKTGFDRGSAPTNYTVTPVLKKRMVLNGTTTGIVDSWSPFPENVLVTVNNSDTTKTFHKRMCKTDIVSPSAVKNLFDINGINVVFQEKAENTGNALPIAYNWQYTDSEGTGLNDILLGRIDLFSLYSDCISGIYYKENGESYTKAVYGQDASGENGFWVTDPESGGTLSKIYIDYGENSVDFDFLYMTQTMSTMVGKNTYANQTLNNYFNGTNVRNLISGYNFYTGNEKLFSELSYEAEDDAGPAFEDKLSGDIMVRTFNVYDVVSVDCSAAGTISTEERETIASHIGDAEAKKIKRMLPQGAKSIWFAYIDKTSGQVDPSIKLKIVDAMGANPNDPDENSWSKMEFLDLTEHLKLSSGAYIDPSDTNFAANLKRFINNTDINYYRTKVRFSLCVDGDGLFLNEDGYDVVIGYAAMSEDQSELKVFEIFRKKYNPYSRVMDDVSLSGSYIERKYSVFLTENKSSGPWRRNNEDWAFGNVYLPCPKPTQSESDPPLPVANVGARVICDDIRNVFNENTGKYEDTTFRSELNSSAATVSIWHMKKKEASDEPETGNLVRNNLYYISKRQTEPDKEMSTSTLKYRVHRRQGCYLIPVKDSDFYFSLDDNDTLDFAPEVYFSSSPDEPDENVYKDNTNESKEDNYHYGNGGDLLIYDIDALKRESNYGVGCGKGCVYAKANLSSGAQLTVKIGSVYENGEASKTFDVSTRDWVRIYFDQQKIEGKAKSDVNLYDTRRIRVFLEKNTVSSDSLSIPDYYTKLIENSGKLTFEDNFYEKGGGFYIKFKEFQPESVMLTDIERVPNIEAGTNKFYIVNRFKKFGVRALFKFDGGAEKRTDNEGNEVKITGGTTKWRAFLSKGGAGFDESKLVWGYPENMYFMAANDALGIIQLTCDENGKDVGTLKYGEIGYYMKLVGEPSYSIDIIIDKLKVKSFNHEFVKGVDTPTSTEFGEIKCLEPMYITFEKNVVGLTEGITLVNDTSNTNGMYHHYELISDHGDYDWILASDESKKKYDVIFPANDTYSFTVKAYLSEDWAGERNDELLTEVVGVDSPTLITLSKMDYDDQITRVLDGYELKYPYQLNEILFAPNEWLTADNLNLRFKKIMEDLRYLKNQTKFYLRPPSVYGGYYGDYETVLDGKAQRKFGYIPNGDLEIYRKCNENQSLDDDLTVMKNCNDVCTDTENNLYACVGSKVYICNTAKYDAKIGEITPYKINEFIKNIDRIEHSTYTDLLYMLCKKTHKLYIFNSYKFNRRNEALNISYYGEIGGYGGKTANSKFNNPTDMFISSVLSDPNDPDSEMIDEIWVCDTGNSAVKRFSIKGQWINTIDLSSVEEKIISVCIDYKNQVHVLTQKYVFTYKSDGTLVNIFELEDKIKVPLLIRPQYAAGFVYVLYEHWIAKYSYDGKFVARFAENDELTYISMYTNHNYDVYITTNKNILRYNDSLLLRELAVMENADPYLWKEDEYMLNRNENVQDAVINTALQRVYDNIVLYAKCIFSRVIPLYSDNDDERISDLDQAQQQRIIDAIHKERIFVGINELVTVDVINRSLKQMYDLLEILLDSI